MVFEIIRWVSLVILWVCIIVNWLMIFRNHRLSKQWKKLIEQVEDNLAVSSLIRDRYEEWLGSREEASDGKES